MMRLHAWGRSLLLAVLASAGAAGCLSPEAVRKIEEGPEGTGVMLSRLPAVIRILATYEATAAQQAEARATVARLEAQHAAAAKPVPAEVVAEEEVPAARAVASPEVPVAPLPEFIAVPVAPDARQQGEVQVMIWDTRSAEFIDNNVYDAATKPEEGVEMRWETRSATLAVVYLGEGRGVSLPGS